MQTYVAFVTCVIPRLRLIGHRPTPSVPGPNEKAHLQDLTIEREVLHVEPLA